MTPAWSGVPHPLRAGAHGGRRHTARLVGAATTIALLVAVATFWPARLGGPVTYVTTHGTSMLPGLHQGDVVAVRTAKAYRVGDVVAYRSQLLHTVVLHRVVDIDHGRFVFKGDNNSWLDPERPASGALIGRVWLHVPRGGSLLASLRAALALALAFAAITAPTAVSRGRRPRPERNQMRRRSATSGSPAAWRSAALTLAACAAASVALVAFAFAQPTTQPVRTSVPYTERAVFSYTAAAPGPVYPTGRVRSGDPVYLRLVRAIDVTVTSAFDTPAPHSTISATALRADVSDGTGWHDSIELAPPARFQGTGSQRTARLDLESLQARLAEIRAATGIASTTYTLDLVADLRTTGTIGGHPVHAEFAPRLHFQLDALRLTLVNSTGEGRRSLTRSASQHLTVEGHAPKRLELRGTGIAVDRLRRLAIFIALGSALSALIARYGMSRCLPDDAGLIARRHQPHLVDITATELHNGNTVFDVATFDDFVRLADHHAMFILHERTATSDSYRFDIDRTTYRHRRPRSRSTPAAT